VVHVHRHLQFWSVDEQERCCRSQKPCLMQTEIITQIIFHAMSVITVLYTSTLSVLKNPVMLPLPYRISKSVPFFSYVDDLVLSYLSCNTEEHIMFC